MAEIISRQGRLPSLSGVVASSFVRGGRRSARGLDAQGGVGTGCEMGRGSTDVSEKGRKHSRLWRRELVGQEWERRRGLQSSESAISGFLFVCLLLLLVFFCFFFLLVGLFGWFFFYCGPESKK